MWEDFDEKQDEFWEKKSFNEKSAPSKVSENLGLQFHKKNKLKRVSK